MTITPTGFSPYAGSIGPLNRVTPFTHRDNATFLTILKGLVDYINETLTVETDNELERIITEFNNALNQKGSDWFDLFNEFIENIEAQIAVLNDESVAGLIADKTSVTGLKIRELFGYEFNPRDYGALGDGVANDVPAIRAALAAAGVASALDNVQSTVVLTPGEYECPVSEELVWVFPGDGQFSKRFFDVPPNVRVKGEGGVITYTCSYDDRAVIFFTTGSNTTYETLKFRDKYDMAGGSRPTGIPIAGGDAYDATIEGTIENIVVDGCEFNRPWHPTKFGMTKTSGTGAFKNITIKNNKSYGEKLSTSSGGYNFVSKGPGRITDVKVLGNSCYDVTVSAAVGLYGVHDFVVDGNSLFGSNINGGGVQTENGAFNGVISDNLLVDHFNHVWLDDSNDITVTGNKMRNTTPDNNAKAVRMTYQGFDNDISHKAGDFTIVGNNAKNCHICTELFSVPQAGGVPTMGAVTIANNHLNLDGTVVQIGIRTGSADSVNITGNTVKGASSISIRLSPNLGQEIIVTNNLTKKVGAESSVGLDIITAEAVHPLVANNRFVNNIAAGLTYVSGRIGDMKIISGTGAPTMSGNPGDWYSNRSAATSDTALYVKSDVGLLGWTAK